MRVEMSNTQVKLEMTNSKVKVKERKRPGFFQLLFQSPTGTAGLFIVVLVCISSLFAPVIAPYDPNAMDLMKITKPPFWMEGGSLENILGTDNMGRDILSRILYGSQISIVVGVLATLVSGIIGMVLGLVSGYYGGFVDSVIMRIADAIYSIPGILLAMVAMMVVGRSGIIIVVMVIAISSWVMYARLIRSEVLRLKNREFIKASVTIGTKNFFIMMRHIIPNVWSSFIVVSTISVAHSILTESTLSFLGLGIQQPLVSWGVMLSDGRVHLGTSWWVATFPGLAITIMVLGIMFLGNWMRDVLDPRNQGIK